MKQLLRKVLFIKEQFNELVNEKYQTNKHYFFNDMVNIKNSDSRVL